MVERLVKEPELRQDIELAKLAHELGRPEHVEPIGVIVVDLDDEVVDEELHVRHQPVVLGLASL